jgi:hypothetical protein
MRRRRRRSVSNHMEEKLKKNERKTGEKNIF